MLQSKKEKETKEMEVKKELKECITLWKSESKNNTEYLTGFASEDPNIKLVGFFNGKKKNPNEPDIRIYVKDTEGKLGQDHSLVYRWFLVAGSSEQLRLHPRGSLRNHQKRQQIFNGHSLGSNRTGNQPRRFQKSGAEAHVLWNYH